MSKLFFQMAWRNVWRNPRRTAVITSAVAIGVWSMIFMGAFSRGTIVNMLENGIKTLTGDVQIHHAGYRDDPAIENSIKDINALTTALRKILPPDALWTQRVRLSAVASNARHTTGVTLVGIDPAREDRVSFIGDAVWKGKYLTPSDNNEIIVGKALLDKFETKIGHRLVLMSQAEDREIASLSFKIMGVFRAEMEATEKQYVFVTLPAARRMLKMGEDISEVSILLSDHDDAGRVASSLKKNLPDSFEVQTWRELLPMLTAYLGLMDGFMLIWYLVVFIAMSFGIVNTLLMAVFERMREFGLCKALGMRPARIVYEVVAESMLLLVMGTVIGNILSFASVYALSGVGLDLSSLAAGAEFAGISRVIYPVVAVKDLAMSNLVVFALGIVVSLYPAVKAARFKPVEALVYT